MPCVSKEQIARAKEWDVLSYLQTFEPQELQRSGAHEYCTKTHDSLKISNGKWCWNSRGIGGRTALDYLIKVRGMDFVDAVETLCGHRSPPPPSRPAISPPKPFHLPEARCCPASVVRYLQDRGIDPEIVGACLRDGTLYESRRYQNCVFVGKDPEGRARSASLRGTRDDFRADVKGSDKRYSFSLLAADPDCPRLAVAESPIDALSLATLRKLSGSGWRACHYLSLGGTSPRALLQFLQDHPKTARISLCLDNDRAGMVGMERLERAVWADPALSRRVERIHRAPPVSYGKDYNDLLRARIRETREGRERTKIEVR